MEKEYATRLSGCNFMLQFGFYFHFEWVFLEIWGDINQIFYNCGQDMNIKLIKSMAKLPLLKQNDPCWAIFCSFCQKLNELWTSVSIYTEFSWVI